MGLPHTVLKIASGPLGVDKTTKEFLAKMLALKASDRFSVSEALAHAYLAKGPFGGKAAAMEKEECPAPWFPAGVSLDNVKVESIDIGDAMMALGGITEKEQDTCCYFNDDEFEKYAMAAAGHSVSKGCETPETPWRKC